ncbi:MAG TPA: hypothetical protein VKH19_16630 [Gemmatimonadaceae bacterium]|nr:hypothetical protein [Gemmatimonadaceae bacterium]
MNKWTRVLRNCDLRMARDEIVNFHEIAQREAQREGSDAYFPEAYVRAWEAFRDTPTMENAWAFLDIAPTLAAYFAACAPGGEFYEITRALSDPGLVSPRPNEDW